MPKVTIILEPTGRRENVGGISFRVYEGRASTGAQLQMLGLFRIPDPEQRAIFERAVCIAEPGDAGPVRIIGDGNLSNV